MDYKMMPPRYKHDCDHCRFLGRHLNADLYFCECSNGSRNPRYIVLSPTVIARFSDSGSDYVSGLDNDAPCLVEARKRSIEAGYLRKLEIKRSQMIDDYNRQLIQHVLNGVKLQTRYTTKDDWDTVPDQRSALIFLAGANRTLLLCRLKPTPKEELLEMLNESTTRFLTKTEHDRLRVIVEENM